MVCQMTAAELAASVRKKEVSVREAVEGSLERIGRFDDDYGAFLTVDGERALEQADAVQAMVDRGEGGPLAGVPIALKDNLSTKGTATTCASKILEGYVPPYDATVVAKGQPIFKIEPDERFEPESPEAQAKRRRKTTLDLL